MGRVLFKGTGAHVLVDGQFGSTGKGGMASFLADRATADDAARHFAGAISSNGPNSGHTSYFGHAKIVLKQLPTFAVHMSLWGHTIPIYLSAGAVINPDILRMEALQYPGIPIFVHPNAAIITPDDIANEESPDGVSRIASTMSGTGAAIARKVNRRPEAIAREALGDMPKNVAIQNHELKPWKHAYFMEVAQGFSLGLNSQFYPHVTSRECTVMQGIADARIAPRDVSMVYMTARSFPIRVGDYHGNSSGDWYWDQLETTWEEIGRQPELTTVTQRIRRVATFSPAQLTEAIRANSPDWLGLTFLDYVPEWRSFVQDIREDILSAHHHPIQMAGSFGPRSENWQWL